MKYKIKGNFIALIFTIFSFEAAMAEETGFRIQNLLKISGSERTLESKEIKKLMELADSGGSKVAENSDFYCRIWILGGWGDTMITISHQDLKVCFFDTRDSKPFVKDVEENMANEIKKNLLVLSQDQYPIQGARPQSVYTDVPIVICESWEKTKYRWFVRNINLAGEEDYNLAMKVVGEIVKLRSIER